MNLLNGDNQINQQAAAETEAAAFSDAKLSWWRRFINNKFFSKKMKILFLVFFGSLFVYILSRFVPALAEFWTRYPSQGVRFVLSKLTGWLPFSLAECLLISIPIFAIAYIVASTVSTKRDDSDENFHRWLRPLVSVLLVLCILFFVAFGPAYSRYTLAENLGMAQNEVTPKDLFRTAKIVGSFIKTNDIAFDKSGASVMPYDYNVLVDKMNVAFASYAEKESYISHFSSNPKPIALSKPMLYTHISGIYTFMTGESNINVEYPDFLIPFTMAHEMAHQRGIAREDEANFVAFLVCIGSDDSYIQYSGYANMMNYLANALFSADEKLFKELTEDYMPNKVLGEFIAYSYFFDDYRDSVVGDITGAVNDAFLQSQGQSAGTKSYGLVVDLAVAYFKEN